MLAKGIGLTGWREAILYLAMDSWPTGLPGHACLCGQWCHHLSGENGIPTFCLWNLRGPFPFCHHHLRQMVVSLGCGSWRLLWACTYCKALWLSRTWWCLWEGWRCTVSGLFCINCPALLLTVLGKKFSFILLSSVFGGLQIKLTKDRLARGGNKFN